MTSVLRRAGVGALVAAATAAGFALCGGEQGPAPSRHAVDHAAPSSARARASTPPALARDVGRLVILRFNGPALPAYARRALSLRRAAGVVLFPDNVRDRAQTRRLTGAVARASGGRALVMADQEGGAVRVVPWAGPELGASGQVAAGTVRAASRAAGRELRGSGVTVALAPVADVPRGPASALAGRAFSSGIREAARAVADAVAGFVAGGVAPAVKHFPGLGAARSNTDDEPVDIGGAPALAPFEAAVRAGVPLVMVSHARYPALDPHRIASQSHTVVAGLLRRRLGFRGVALTDSLEAAAVLETGSVEEAARRSVAAGIDLLLTTGRGSSLRVYRSLLAEARRSPRFEARVRGAARRVGRLQLALERRGRVSDPGRGP